MKTPHCTLRETGRKREQESENKGRLEGKERGKRGGKRRNIGDGGGMREVCVCVCLQINVDVFERVRGRVGSFGLFSLAHLPGEAATNRKV